ncbi:2Fe-2S iron-sulfur cluster-binding protein [Paraburkholderia sediminicola]|uniref:2Fe-2S iron-sulfur cluster-binding protein n=1 Tax=Paraburkholderia sediminicola TaxID=458836 RepID=UPI0038B77BC3
MELYILPAGKTVTFQEGANLLDVLQRNDVSVSYSCSAGRCGTCRCKVIKGQVIQKQSASAMPQALLSDDHPQVLACQATLIENCVIEIPEPDEIVIHPAKILKATVEEIENLTHDIKLLRLRPAKSISFSPGQYASLQFTPEHVRPYSMAGLDSDELLEFHIRLMPEGRVSSYVAHSLRVGDTVRLSGPLGTSYLRRKHEGPMLCVAGGTGLAPVLSIIRGALSTGMRNPIHLYFGARSAEDVYGQERLADLAKRYPNLHVNVTVASGLTANGQRKGVVTDAVFSDWEELAGWRAYLCGAPPMVEAATVVLRGRGLRPEHIHADAFYTTGI